MRAPRQDPPNPFCKFAPLVDISAPCSSFTPELPKLRKAKNSNKRQRERWENQTPNDKSEVQFPFRCTSNRENNPNALCESISHVSLILPSGSIHAITALEQIFRCALFLPWNSCSDPCQCNTFSYMPVAPSAWCLSHRLLVYVSWCLLF